MQNVSVARDRQGRIANIRRKADVSAMLLHRALPPMDPNRKSPEEAASGIVITVMMIGIGADVPLPRLMNAPNTSARVVASVYHQHFLKARLACIKFQELVLVNSGTVSQRCRCPDSNNKENV
jgi:hypothetical protein